MNNLSKILFLIYFIAVIPIIYIYFTHGIHELEESQTFAEQANDSKSKKALAEGGFMLGSGIGYVLMSILIIIKPDKPMLYLIIIIGTLIIFAVFFLRSVVGLPVPGTDYVIKKFSVGWDETISKFFQTVLLVPTSMLLMERIRR